MVKYTKNSYNSMAKKKKNSLKMGRGNGLFLAIRSAWLSKSLFSISLILLPSKMSHSGSLWPFRWFGQDTYF